MEHNPPTMGDYAYGMAQGQQSQVRHLSQRLDAAEEHIDFLVDVVNALLDHMYGPDEKWKPEAVLKVVKDYELRVRDLGQH